VAEEEDEEDDDGADGADGADVLLLLPVMTIDFNGCLPKIPRRGVFRTSNADAVMNVMRDKFTMEVGPSLFLLLVVGVTASGSEVSIKIPLD
jgi:hypothetical protein